MYIQNENECIAGHTTEISARKPNNGATFAGEILIDGHNIKDLDLNFLRRNIGAVSQEPSLFSGTINDNLKVGKMDANHEEIQSAAMMANAHSFVSQLPNQYLTEASEKCHIPPIYTLLLVHPVKLYLRKHGIK